MNIGANRSIDIQETNEVQLCGCVCVCVGVLVLPNINLYTVPVGSGSYGQRLRGKSIQSDGKTLISRIRSRIIK